MFLDAASIKFTLHAFVLLCILLFASLPILLGRGILLSRRKKSSREPLHPVGRLASVEQPLNPVGAVLVCGEVWRARSRSGESVACGRDNVRVVGASGHLLEVESVL